jgi:RNA polymerase sigma factor (sigma-70 family)
MGLKQDVRMGLVSSATLELLVANRAAFLDFVAARVESRAAAEDILQEALSRALEHADELRANEAAVGWFYQVLRNAVVDHYRRRESASKGLERLAAEPALAHAEAAEPPPKVCKCVARLAKSLKPEYADALQKVEIEGAAVKSFGDEAGITPGNAAVRVFRAREALKKKVVSTCGACAAAGCTDCDCVSSSPD